MKNIAKKSSQNETQTEIVTPIEIKTKLYPDIEYYKKHLDEITLDCDVREQETVINFQRQSDLCSVWTSDNTVLTKLRNMLKANPKAYSISKMTFNMNGNPTSITVTCPKKFISFRIGKELSEEQKQIRRDKLSQARNAMTRNTIKK